MPLKTDLINLSKDLQILSNAEKKEFLYALNNCYELGHYEQNEPKNQRKDNFYRGAFDCIVRELAIKLMGDFLVNDWGMLTEEELLKNKQDKRYIQQYRIIKGVKDFMSASKEEREKFYEDVFKKAPHKVGTYRNHLVTIRQIQHLPF